MPTTVLPSVTRCHYLDNLKVLLTVLVVFHHAGQAYGDGGAWPYSPSLSHEYVGWLGNFFPVNAAFFMWLFFLISAYFIPGSLDRSGTKQFVRKRAIRLGVPMLVVLILSLSVTGKAEFAHTWFLEHLLFYSLAYVCIYEACRKYEWGLKRDRRLNLLRVLLLAAGLSAVTYYVRLENPIDHWKMLGGFLSSEPAHLPQYVLMFALGIVAYRNDWFGSLSPSVGKVLLAVAGLMVLLVYLRPVYPFLGNNIWKNWWWYEALLCLSLSFGLIYLYRVRFNRTSPFRRWLADQAYGVYFFHLFVIIGLQYAFDGFDMGSGTVKFLFIGICATVMSFALVYLARSIPGMKRVL